MEDFKETRLEEVLIRFDPKTGQLKGAHYREAVVEVFGGRMMPVEVGDPIPIPAADNAALVGVIGIATMQATAEAARLSAALEAEQRTTDGLRTAADNDKAKIAQLEATVADLAAQLEGRSPVINGVPQIVPMNKARKALALGGLLQMVEDAVAAAPAPEGDLIRIDWEYSDAVRRDSPFVTAMMGAIGLTGEQADALFVAAASLP